jgi:hypothetical protein
MTNKGLTNQAGDTLPGLRPEQFPLGSEKSRAAARALLMRRSDQVRSRIRAVIETVGAPIEPPTFDGSVEEPAEGLSGDSERLPKCSRRLGRDGMLIEILEGSGFGEMTEEELTQFVEQFPIERIGRPGRQHASPETISP